MFSQRLSMSPSICQSNTSPVPEVQIPSNMSVALKLCFLCNLGSPSQSSSIRRKTCHASNTATHYRDSSNRTNRATMKLYSYVYASSEKANGVTVFEGSPIRYNRGSLRTELQYLYSYQ